MKEAYLEIKKLFKEKKYSEAIVEVQRILINLPSDENAEILTRKAHCKFLLGEIYKAQGSTQKALKSFREAANLLPRTNNKIISCYIKIGNCYEELAQLILALNAYEQIFHLAPEFKNSDIEEICKKAGLAKANADYKEACDYYHQAISLLLRNIKIKNYFEKAKTHKLKKEYQAELIELDNALSLSYSYNDKMIFYFEKALAYRNLGELDIAFSIFTKLRTYLNKIEAAKLTSEMQTGRALVNCYLGIISFTQGSQDLSEAFFKEALAIDINDRIKAEIRFERDKLHLRTSTEALKQILAEHEPEAGPELSRKRRKRAVISAPPIQEVPKPKLEEPSTEKGEFEDFSLIFNP